MSKKCFIPTFLLLILSFKVYTQGMINVADSQGLFGFSSTDYNSGISFVDFDLDGDDDITIGTHIDIPILFFENQNGSFKQVGFVADIQRSIQVTWVDYDNDGDLDISYSGFGMKLFENVGDMQFEDVTSNLGIEDSCTAYTTNWADFDKDGDLDFFLTQFACSDGLEYYKNNGDKTFSLANNAAGIEPELAEFALAASVIDYDNDGWEDFHIAVDFQLGNVLLKNNGDGTFSNVSAQTDADILMDGMSSTVGDVDLDGDMDIYVTNTFYDDRPGDYNKLLINIDTDRFIDVSGFWGVWGGGWSWGAQFLDVDGDFDLDLHVNVDQRLVDDDAVNPAVLYFNDYQNLRFIKDESSITYSRDDDAQYVYGYGSAQGDFNQDGYVDLFSNTQRSDVILLKNEWNSTNWLKVNLTGVESNLMGIGTRIEAYVDGKKMLRHVRCGEGYASQNSYTQFFGLSDFTKLDSLVLRWPLGIVDTSYDVDANSVIRCVEGQELINDLGFNGFWQNAACENGDADLVLAFQGGKLPYDFELRSLDGDLVIAGQINEPASRAIRNVPLDQYNIQVTDSDMNTFTTTINKSFTIESPDISTVIVDSFSSNSSNGEVSITADGGLPPYRYRLYDETGDLLSMSSYVTELDAGDYTVEVLDANDCSSTELINIGLVNSLEEYISSHVSIFPNPTADILHISLVEIFEGTIQLEDAQGKYLYSVDNESLDQSVNISALNNGVYFLVFSSNDGLQSAARRIVVLK